MVIMTQSDIQRRVDMPKDLKSKLNVNPFVEDTVNNPIESANYNTSQLVEALIKRSQNIPLNQNFRPADEYLDEQNKLKDKARTLGESIPTRVPEYLPMNALTEQEAFDEYLSQRGEEAGDFLNTDKFGLMSNVQLDLIKAQNPDAYRRGVERYNNYLAGGTQTPDTPLLARNKEELNSSLQVIRKFKDRSELQGRGDVLLPRIRPSKTIEKSLKEKEAAKNETLSAESANGFVNIVNELERDSAKDVAVEKETFLRQPSELSPEKTVYETIKDSYNLDPSKEKYFSTVATAGLVNIVDHLRMIKSDKQALSAYLGVDQALIEDDNIGIKRILGKFTKPIKREAKIDDRATKNSLDNLKRGINVRNRQPILNSIMTKLDSYIRRNLAPDSIGTNTLEAAGSLLRYFTEKGYLNFGRTKGGYIVPVMREHYGIQNISQTELATAYDPELRQQKYSTVNASTFPITTAFDTKQRGEWKKFLTPGKDLEGRSSISSAFLNINKNNPISINEELFSMLSPIQNQVMEDVKRNSHIGGSKHPLAKLLGEIDSTAYQLYKARDNKEANKPYKDIVERKDANSLVHQHIVTLNERMSKLYDKLQEQKAGDLKYFCQWYKSGATGRYFVMDAIFNHINDKGLIRTIMDFGYKLPVNIDNNYRAPRFGSIMSIAQEALEPSGAGLNKFDKVNTNLHALPKEQLHLMDFLYALGKTADKYKILGVEEGNTLDTPIKGIEHGIKAFEAMAARGTAYRSWIPKKDQSSGGTWRQVDVGTPNERWVLDGNAFPDHSRLNDIDKQIFSKKGEWHIPVSLAMDASKLKEAISKGDKTFNFNYKFEQDARQSNATMQSILTGDFEIAGLLGILPELAKRVNIDGKEVTSEDLRDLLLSDVAKTVKLTLNNNDQSEKDRSDAIIKFFNDSKPLYGSKVLVGGLIVAGLYGKSPHFMYQEAEDMIAKTGAEGQALVSAYNGNIDLLTRDIAQVYNRMAKEHMAGLMGFQDMMKSIGTIMMSFDGPTEIPGIYPGENIVLAVDELQPVSTEKIVGDEIKRELSGQNLGGWFFPEFRKGREAQSASPEVEAQRAAAARNENLKQLNEDWRSGAQIPGHISFEKAKQKAREKAERTAEDYNKPILQNNLGDPLKNPDDFYQEPMLDPKKIPSAIRGEEGTEDFRVLGSQGIRAFPVVMIQNMDSLALAMSFMIANGNSNVPPAALGIHDAIISTAGSTLLMHNAYNNIVPQVFARSGKNFFDRVFDTLYSDVVYPIMSASDNASFNIGTEEVYSNQPYTSVDLENKENISNLKNLSAVTNYFDQIHNRLKSKEEFYKPEQAIRKRVSNRNKIVDVTNKEFSDYQKELSARALMAARDAGYRPPGSGNRKSYSVNGRQMKKLMMIMLEREGVLSPEFRNVFADSRNGPGLYNESKVPIGDEKYAKVPGTNAESIDGSIRHFNKLKKIEKQRKFFLTQLSRQKKSNNNLD